MPPVQVGCIENAVAEMRMTIVVEEDGTEREWTFGEMMEACDPGYKAKMTREFMTKLFLSDWYKRMFE